MVHFSVSDPVYSELRERVLSGDLVGGTPLRQDEIAARHGISKIPVREALRRLETEGLVEFKPRRGAFVREVDDQEILDLLDIRIALETRALELAIPNMVAADFDEAQNILNDYAASVNQEEWGNLNQRFHRAILEPCGNKRLLGMIDQINTRMSPLLRLRVTKISGLERPVLEHDRILDACLAGDVEEAVEELKSHIEVSRKELAAEFRSKAVA